MHRPTRSTRGGRRGRLALRGSLAALLTAGLLAPVGATAAVADVPTADPLPAAAGWVAGSLDATASPSAVRLADAILAFAATGSAGDAGAAAFDALVSLGDDALTIPGDAAKALLAAAAQGAGDTAFAGDAETVLREAVEVDGRIPYNDDQTQLFVQSLAILALATTDAGAPAAAVDFLADRICPDGGLNVPGNCDLARDVDTTAVAAQALLAAGADPSAPVGFLLEAQHDDGSFGPSGDRNTNATALAAQALRAAGEVEAADEALAWVLARQHGCGSPADVRGSFRTYADADADLWIATTQGVFAAAAPLHELDATAAAAETAYLNCSTDLCPAGGGVSVVVDFTALLPESAPVVACAPRLPAGRDGLDVLRAAGFELETQEFDFGGGAQEFLCSIDGLPELPEGECFSSEGYFSYWNAPQGGDWEAYEVGGSSSNPQDGTIEGWSWAPDFAAAPPRVSTTPARVTLPEPPYDRGIADACPGSYPRTFTDIAGSVHEGAIRCLAAADITKGTSDPDRYAPRAEVTRAQLASLVARSYEQATGGTLPAGRPRFRDVAGSTHERNINALAEAGVIRGVGDGTRFAPNETVTRSQMASLLARFLDLLDDDQVDGSFPPATDRDVFTDDDGSTHESAIDRLAAQGVVQGRRDGSYGPNADVTRDQLATFLARSLDLGVDAGLGSPVG